MSRVLVGRRLAGASLTLREGPPHMHIEHGDHVGGANRIKGALPPVRMDEGWEERLAAIILRRVLGLRPHPWLRARFAHDVIERLTPTYWELSHGWVLWWLDAEGIAAYNPRYLGEPHAQGLDRPRRERYAASDPVAA